MNRSLKILAFALMVAVSLPLAAQDEQKKKKKGNRQRQSQVGTLLKKLEGAGLAEEQLAKIKDIVKELQPKLQAISAKRREAIGAEAVKEMAAARKAAQADGKKGKEQQEASLAVLSAEQKSTYLALQKEQTALMSSLRAKITEVVGPEKAKELKLTRGAKKGGKKKGVDKKAAK